MQAITFGDNQPGLEIGDKVLPAVIVVQVNIQTQKVISPFYMILGMVGNYGFHSRNRRKGAQTWRIPGLDPRSLQRKDWCRQRRSKTCIGCILLNKEAFLLLVDDRIGMGSWNGSDQTGCDLFEGIRIHSSWNRR